MRVFGYVYTAVVSAFIGLMGLSSGLAADLETISRPLLDPFHTRVHRLADGTLQILPEEPKPEVREWKPPQERVFVQEEVSSEVVPVPRPVTNPTAWPNSAIGFLETPIRD